MLKERTRLRVLFGNPLNNLHHLMARALKQDAVKRDAYVAAVRPQLANIKQRDLDWLLAVHTFGNPGGFQWPWGISGVYACPSCGHGCQQCAYARAFVPEVYIKLSGLNPGLVISFGRPVT